MVAIYQKNIIQSIKMNTTDNLENVCSICLNNLDGNNVCRTNCNHLFCFECLCQHVMSGANPSCPCCRNDFVSNDFISSIRATTSPSRFDTPRLERQDSSVYPAIRNFADESDIYLNANNRDYVTDGPVITISNESYSDHPIFRNVSSNPMTIDELSNENNNENNVNESALVTPPINENNEYEYTLVYNNYHLNDVCRNLDSWFGAETDFTNSNSSITIIPNINNNVRLI